MQEYTQNTQCSNLSHKKASTVMKLSKIFEQALFTKEDFQMQTNASVAVEMHQSHSQMLLLLGPTLS